MTPLGQRIKVLREEKNITQEQLAKCIDISRGSLSMIEISKREPDNYTLVKLADYFDTTIDFLLGRTNQRYPQDKEYKQQNLYLDNVFIADQNKSGQSLLTIQGLKQIIREVILEMRDEKLLEEE